VTTNDAGRFASNSIFPGQYLIDINDGHFQGSQPYPKIGTVSVRAGETADVQLTTAELKRLQDPFRITGTAVGEDGKSMVYGGVGVRLVGGNQKLRFKGGGIDGRNIFSLAFGPVERIEPSADAPYGVGTHDIELIGNNGRFGFKLARRTPSEPLRITDNPNQAELLNGIRYIRPNQPVEFQLVFAKVDQKPSANEQR
jgi:hypothetical protein